MTYWTFPTWASVLRAASVGAVMLYQAPLDRYATHVRVLRVFKNGKLRLRPLVNEPHNFTADAAHAERFRSLVQVQP